MPRHQNIDLKRVLLARRTACRSASSLLMRIAAILTCRHIGLLAILCRDNHLRPSQPRRPCRSRCNRWNTPARIIRNEANSVAARQPPVVLWHRSARFCLTRAARSYRSRPLRRATPAAIGHRKMATSIACRIARTRDSSNLARAISITMSDATSGPRPERIAPARPSIAASSRCSRLARPWCKALRQHRRFPAAVLGPVLLVAFLRLASICRCDATPEASAARGRNRRSKAPMHQGFRRK
ncbi:hypothetical protein ACVWXP_003832 [Bradyrhizobium sp. USDA 4463]